MIAVTTAEAIWFSHLWSWLLHAIVIPWYEYDITVITRVRVKVEYKF